MGYFNDSAISFGSDGSARVNLSHSENRGAGSGNGNSGNNGTSGGNEARHEMFIHNGQMGYWEYREVVGSDHEHTAKTFIPVGPSEAEKKAAASELAKETQKAEAASREFALKISAAAATAELQRQNAVSQATLAGQFQSVQESQKKLDVAIQEATKLRVVSENSLNDARNKRQAASSALITATRAEQAWKEMAQKIESKRPRGKSIIAKNGVLGFEERRTRETAEHPVTYLAFVSIEITVAQRDAVQADATNKRSIANRLAAEANVSEQASLLATVNYNNAETRRLSASAALVASQQAASRAAEAERQRQLAEAAAALAAEEKRLADEAVKAAEEARDKAEREKLRQLRQAAADKLKSSDVQSVRGLPASMAPASFPLMWAVASAGGVSLDRGVAASVWPRISATLAELRSIATVGAVGPVAAVIAGLLYSEEVGAGSDIVPGRDISSLMPADVFALPEREVLEASADTGASVSMSIRGRMVTRANGVLETQFVRTPVAGEVQVVRAVLDTETGYWGYTLPALPGIPSRHILVSPSDAPGSEGPLGLAGPVPLTETIIHTGGQAELPSQPTVLISPQLGEIDFRDLILIFPEESGLKPLYVMQSSPYGETSEKGKYSGRPYNPDQAGGPVENLDWSTAVIEQDGLEMVKMHTGRFGNTAGNQVMIDRLEKILRGDLQITDTDKRFYTHEIRELERYRNLGIGDGEIPHNRAIVWNNTHTATLEDYKINERTDPLYTPEAEEAFFKEEEGK